MVEPYFKGIQPVKRIKRVVHFIITLFWRYWTTNRRQIDIKFDMKISVDDIAFSGVFTTVFTCRRSDILEPTKSPKNIFSQQITHST